MIFNFTINNTITENSISSNNSTLLLSSKGYLIVAIVLFFIGFFGFFFNLFVIIRMVRNKALWTPINVILFNLICSDFSVSILGNPLTTISAIYQRWVFDHMMCVAYGFFMSLLGIASITTLMVLAFERYVMIVRPLRSHHLTNKGAKVIVSCIWLYALGLTGPPLFGWGSYANEAANISCSVNWEQKSVSTTSYIIFLFVFGLVIPVFVICFSYMNIIITLRKRKLKSTRTTKAESRVALMVAVMIVAFFIAWTPYSIFALLVAFGDSSNVTTEISVIPAIVAKSSICYNPLIYVGLNSQLQKAATSPFAPPDDAHFRSAKRKTSGARVNSENTVELTMLTRATRHNLESRNQ